MDAQAGTVGQKLIMQALKALERQGKLTADDLIAAARSPKHPLHDRFEWDDTVAGQKWRIYQAREIIRSVQVVVTTESRTLEVPVYVRDPRVEEGDQGYAATEKLTPEDKRSALNFEITRVVSALDRAQRLAEAFGMAKAVQEITRRVKALQVELRTGANA
jgi:hypothetical protein